MSARAPRPRARVLTTLRDATDILNYQLRQWTPHARRRATDNPEDYAHTWQALIDDIDATQERLTALRAYAVERHTHRAGTPTGR